MYKPFQKHLEEEIHRRFDLQPMPLPDDLERQVSERGKNSATIQSWCYSCSQLRKLRYTYIDGGTAIQVFNSVIYPSHHYDIPLLGIDLLSFNRRRNVVVIDFQPLFRDADYQAKYIEPMRKMYESFDDLAQNLGMKFYDANQYFSKYLIFAKAEADIVPTRVMEAFKVYVNKYFLMLEEATPLTEPSDIQRIVQAQKDYDQYSAERDPAHGLYSSYFGHEWAERFLYEFLFEDARPVETTVGRRRS
ncbi:MAG: 15,16-dihydrobiliverdin:ferredoxin oxidoreductase [Cyanophyceae cyanobacterium]